MDIDSLLPEQTSAAAAQGESVTESFTTTYIDDGHYTDVSCADGTQFRIGPAGSVEDAVANGIFGLRVCANRNILRTLSLPTQLTRTQLDAAVRTVLSALPVPVGLDDLPLRPSSTAGEPVKRQSGTYTTFTSNTYTWWASCTTARGFQTGNGPASDPSDGAVKVLAWFTSAKCIGGGTTTVSEE
ncbi:MAG: hypothetical protein F4Y92_02180 [Dehalococcoidia bacterium]|nr:hypothetical protein [Dehalococcoidia bacterium]